MSVEGLSAAAALSKRRKVLVPPSKGVDTSILQNDCPPGSGDVVIKTIVTTG